MADWYASSVAYAAVAQFAVSTAYTVGQIVRQLAAPAVGNERCFRCTTAGTSAGTEAAWTLTKGATTTQGTAVFTEVTGNSTYNWSAPFPRMGYALLWGVGTDRIFVSSDSVESYTTAVTWQLAALSVISVNRAGSVPPVAADITPGAQGTSTGASSIIINGSAGYCEGVTFSAGSAANAATITTAGTNSNLLFKNCAFVLGSSSAACSIIPNSASGNTIWDNCTVTFGGIGQTINPAASGTWSWINTPSAIQGATIPTNLFSLGNATGTYTLEGVDLTALGSSTVFVNATSNPSRWRLFDCKLNASTAIGTVTNICGPQYELVNCDSGATNYRNEHYQAGVTQTTETTITRTGGASDGVTTVSRKIVAATPPAIGAALLPIFIWNTTLSSITATVEIISSTTLTNAEIWLEVMYQGSASSPLGSTASSAPATKLTTAASVASSAAAWNSSPATPVAQKLQVTFTPAAIGLLKAVVRITRPSTTLYVDPLITLT